LHGTYKLSVITIRPRLTGEMEHITPTEVFVFIGLSPNTESMPAAVTRNRYGFVVTSTALETTLPSVFAAGDVRQGSAKQTASTAGEGATAALMIREYLNRM